MKVPKQIAIELINPSMFNATGKSDFPVLVIDLTDEQREKIEKHIIQGYNILSIHEIIQD